LKLVYKPRENFVEKQSQIYESRILNQQRYYEFFNQDDEFKKEPAIRLSSAQAHQYDPRRIQEELQRVSCQL